MTQLIFFLVAFFPVWLPVLVACLAHRSPMGVRVVLALSGIGAAVYAYLIFHYLTHDGSHKRDWGYTRVPFTAAALSFFLAFTGVCALTALHYVAAGRARTAPAFAAFGLLAACIAIGIWVVFPFLSWPIR